MMPELEIAFVSVSTSRRLKTIFKLFFSSTTIEYIKREIMRDIKR